jgi:hypothetical protein
MGRADLAGRAVTVLTAAAGRPDALARQTAMEKLARSAALVEVPFDPRLRVVERISRADLAAPTVTALVQAAHAVVAQLNRVDGEPIPAAAPAATLLTAAKACAIGHGFADVAEVVAVAPKPVRRPTVPKPTAGEPVTPRTPTVLAAKPTPAKRATIKIVKVPATPPRNPDRSGS